MDMTSYLRLVQRWRCMDPLAPLYIFMVWYLHTKTALLSKFNSNKLTNQMQQFYKFITWRFVSLNMFLAPPCPSSGAYNCINSLWFYLGALVVAALLVVVWPARPRLTTLLPPCCKVKSEAVNAVVSSWWWSWRCQKHVERHKTWSNKLVKLLHLVG